VTNGAGRQDAFLALLETHHKILFKVASAYCRAPAERDDLVAEMTAALWKSFGRYDERFRFSTWAYRVALNVAISFQRAERRRAERVSPRDFATLEVAAPEVAADERVAQLEAFVAGLGDLDKALMLLYLDEHDYQSIAATLGLTLTNVATKLSRLRARAKSALREDPTHSSEGEHDGER
jgi:RNA polymerase sigma-70 factor (ECF subfamily)